MMSVNPVLFIFLGRVIRLFEPFTRILEEYGLEGIATIKMEEHPHSEWIKDEINRIQQEFIKKPFDSSGIIRISYVMSVGEWDLPKLRATIEKYLAMLYPSDIYTDIYWITDDAIALDGHTESRISTMKMLNSGKIKGAQIYLLSNIGSSNVFCEEEDILRTIALLTLFKDYEPTFYPVAPDASRYNEFLFAENSQKQKKGANFMTAGCRSIQVPKKELKGFLVSLLLSWKKAPNALATGKESKVAAFNALATGRESKVTAFNALATGRESKVTAHKLDFDIGRFVRMEYTPFSKATGPEYIYGLALPELSEGEYSDLPRKSVISRLFGERLDGILEIYKESSVCLKPLESLEKAIEELPFYEALECQWQQEIGVALIKAKDALDSAELELKNWLSAKNDTTNDTRRSLSFWYKQEMWPYRLAEEYIERRFKIAALTALDDHLRQASKLIEDYQTILQGYLRTVDAAKDALKWDIEALNAAFSPFVSDVSEYFLSLFKKYEADRPEILQQLTNPMTRHLKAGTFVDYISQLAQFVESDLMPEINLPFTDLLAYLNKSGQMSQLLSEWAVRGRHFSILLKTGYVGLYSEANLFMPKSGAAKVKSGYESQGLGRMNLFADDRAARIDVLYKAGSFGLEDLYYRDLYV